MTETHSLNQTMHLHSTRHSGGALQELTACGIVLASRVAIHGHVPEVGLRVPEILPGPARWPSIHGY
jgi:hypothetical protein